MNRLVLAFGLVCLLQGLYAEPKPEFGVSLTLDATDRITDVKTAANTIKTSIKALAPVAALTSGYAKLATVKTQVETIITQFDSKSSAILTAYDGLLAATDGNLDNAFNPVGIAIDAAVTYITVDALAINTALSDIAYTGITNQLTDAFGRITAALTELKAQALNVKAGLASALGALPAGSTLTANFLRTYLPLRKMYDLLRAATTLRTYLPLVTYILKTTIENIVEADTYVNGLKTTLGASVSAEAGAYSDDLKVITDDIAGKFAGYMAINGQSAGTVYTNVNALTQIKNAPKIADLIGAVSGMSGLFSTVGAQTTTMTNAFAKIGTSLKGFITAAQNAVSVPDNALVIQLIDTLVGNDKYGRYCYNKYKDVVSGLFSQGFDGGWQCVDKEYQRLEHLRDTVMLILDLLSVDYQDIESQVGVCSQLLNATDLNNCVAALAPFYTELVNATKAKIAAAFTLASDEAAAAENRLLVCFTLVNLDVSITQAATIMGNLEICASQGPLGSD